MKLHQDELYKYFGMADESNSWLQTPTNLFDFVSRNSDTLLVTIGASWTYGSELDPDLRSTTVFGSQLAQRMSADWLNLAIPAQGNFWIAHMVERLSAIISKLNYSNIYCVCTFTDPTRWFNTQFDHHINYVQWFADNTRTSDDFDRLLSMRNQVCVSKILQHLAPFDHVHLLVVTDQIDHTGFEQLGLEKLMPLPWYKILGLNDGLDVKAVLYFSRLDTITNFIPWSKHSMFKKWLLKITELGESREKLLREATDFIKNGHPLEQAHSQWATYIYNLIQK